MVRSSIIIAGTAVTLLAMGVPAIAQDITFPKGGDIPKAFVPVKDSFAYVKREVEVRMRDGVTLHTVILVPRGATRAPIMLDRTPYSADKLMARGGGGPLLEDALFPAYAELAHAGYILVAQDVRGKYKSKGEYVMNRPIVGGLNNTKVDHSTDAYDTIDWLVKHVPESNGRVGTIGTSYDGFTTLMSLVNPHPALKAAVPINPMVDVWKGDDWFHNGAFRQEMMSYVYFQTAKADSSDEWYSDRRDDYATFMHYGSAGALASAMGMDQLPFWRRLSQHPAYDGFWQGQAVDKILARAPLTVPTLFVDAQWDQEDIYGAPAAFAATKTSPNAYFAMGPWHHGEVNRDAFSLGVLDYGSDTASAFRSTVMMPFLDARLKKGAPVVATPKATVYETGTNTWRQYNDWPSACDGSATTLRPLYFGGNFSLTFSQPEGVAGYDEYISDPAKPVTYRNRPNASPYSEGSTWSKWLVDDQRFASARPDVLTYTSDVLTAPVHIAGQPVAHLFASTSGSDSDWVVKLIDVYPDQYPKKPEMGGYELGISMDILRGRYRDDPAHPTPIPANQVLEYKLALPNADHVFLPGHRIMVQVQSSWFPLYDRNPQTYVPNIFFAQRGDFVKATQRVFRVPRQASYVALPIIGGS
jgi:putative CocE/NonD family hydrolase